MPKPNSLLETDVLKGGSKKGGDYLHTSIINESIESGVGLNLYGFRGGPHSHLGSQFGANL